MTSVSVALGAHNGASYIEEQLHSILGQQPPPFELILSDDASTDATVAIAETVARAYPDTHLRLLRNPTALGVTANFEQAMRATTGDVIALSDQDDRWHPGRVATLLAVFDSNPDILVVASDAALIDGDGAPLGQTLLGAVEVSSAERADINSDSAFAALLRRNLLTGATMAVRREVLERAVPFPRSWVHDEWIAAIAASMGGIRLIDDQLIDYRQHGGNQIGARRLSIIDKLRRLREPRVARNARLLARAEALAGRLEHEPFLTEARRKLVHEQHRSALPASHLRRVAPVVGALRAGDYARYGRGRADAVRDLVQPDR